MPAHAPLSDALANPNTALVGHCVLLYNPVTTQWERGRVAVTFKDLNAVSITTIATVWTPAAGKKFRLMGGTISASVAGAVLFEDNAAGAGNFVWRTPKLLVDTPYSFLVGNNGKLSAAINNVLKATLASASISGTLFGTEE
jgi:hypothetical protein